MKIIEDGNIIHCNFCECVYSYNNEDLRPIAQNVLCVTCPKCGQQVMIVPELKLKETRIVEVTGNDNSKTAE